MVVKRQYNGELVFDNVKIPAKNILPGRTGLGAPLSCLDSARYGIAWGGNALFDHIRVSDTEIGSNPE